MITRKQAKGELSAHGSWDGVKYVDTFSDSSFTELWKRRRSGYLVSYQRAEGYKDSGLILEAKREAKRANSNLLVFVKKR